MIRVMNIVSLFTDYSQKIILYSIDDKEEVYIGHVRGIPPMYNRYFVYSIESFKQPSKAITLNINLECEEV